MPDKSSSVISYAAGASLAAVALIYVFGPTFAIDHDASSTSKKKTVVGLRNQANDCFINSVLQALAGLGDLRIYLIRETHRRRIQDPAVYANLVQPLGTAKLEQWKLQGLQDGLVTQGLKEMLDALNERPLSRKSVSALPFVRVLEVAFKQRISRQQQDAQEFLQIVAERLKDEYHAGQRARFYACKNGLHRASSGSTKASSTKESDEQCHAAAAHVGGGDGGDVDHHADTQLTTVGVGDGDGNENGHDNHSDGSGTPPLDVQTAAHLEALSHEMPSESEEGFPLEGKYESHLECQTCKYKTKPREETFCTLTLAVPQVSSTSLGACFDGVFKTEFIDDFKCEMCRLLFVKSNLEREMAMSRSETFIAQAQDSIDKLQLAIDTDPEKPPEDVDLGDIRYAPKRRIAKTTRISVFPKVLALHLSRSIYGIGQITQKNSAKVAFPEELPLGGLMDQRRYKLLGTVTHRGGHNSGHYEAFRRQNQPSHYHNANTFQQSDVYSKTPTPASTPEIAPHSAQTSPAMSTPDLLLSSSSTPSLVSLSPAGAPRSVPAEGAVHRSDSNGSSTDGAREREKRTEREEEREREREKEKERERDKDKDKDKDAETSSLRSVAASTKSALSRLAGSRPGQDLVKMSSNCSSRRSKRRKPGPDKWWRVSDEKVREAKTAEVLGMQREVYLLFYELER
ncbi:hypothetical protein E4U42_004504 [Claviceps africana]|uniref:Ubiquitin carboxyl-terminal hydrolase n=1 Tax=Claviceps africana TaxID=83212 RepID=A0A8K0J4W1_9HYPO|nr:hypothetical protein E4U42_004504 [Claviceps africana]